MLLATARLRPSSSGTAVTASTHSSPWSIAFSGKHEKNMVSFLIYGTISLYKMQRSRRFFWGFPDRPATSELIAAGLADGGLRLGGSCAVHSARQLVGMGATGRNPSTLW